MNIPASSQTIGPFWHLINDPAWFDLTRFGATGERITLEGRVTDGAGAPVRDGAIELWQTSPPASEMFQGYGRTAMNEEGMFRFLTIKPDPVPGPGGIRENIWQAPHCAIAIMARGLLKPLFTRLYFEDSALNETDPVLALVEPARRRTLIAKRTGADAYRLDISLQGGEETVFMEL